MIKVNKPSELLDKSDFCLTSFFGFMKEAIFQRPSLQKMQTNGFWSKQEIEEGSDL